MPSRRHLILGGLAALAARPALGQDASRSSTALPLDALPPLAPLAPAALPAPDPALAEAYQPRLVPLQSGVAPFEIHVAPNSFHLYWTLPGGVAIRYSCGVGRPGLYEAGTFFVGAKKEWPSWTPTPDMVERRPDLYAQYAEEGMPGGPGNPLGARALYLFTPERGDTFMRIHGTFEPQTIGSAVSNGCARLTNPHVEDLYARVPEGTKVYLYPQEPGVEAPAA